MNSDPSNNGSELQLHDLDVTTTVRSSWKGWFLLVAGAIMLIVAVVSLTATPRDDFGLMSATKQELARAQSHREHAFIRYLLGGVLALVVGAISLWRAKRRPTPF